MTGEKMCVFELHTSQECALIRMPLQPQNRPQHRVHAGTSSPQGSAPADAEHVDGGTALFLNRCLLLGPKAKREYRAHEDENLFRFNSPSLGPWNYRIVRPSDDEYQQQFGFLKKASWGAAGYQVITPKALEKEAAVTAASEAATASTTAAAAVTPAVEASSASKASPDSGSADPDSDYDSLLDEEVMGEVEGIAPPIAPARQRAA